MSINEFDFNLLIDFFDNLNSFNHQIFVELVVIKYLLSFLIVLLLIMFFYFLIRWIFNFIV